MDLSILNRALDIKTGKAEIQSNRSGSDQGERVVEIEVEKIKADPNQPRKSFAAEDIQALADDIRSHGLIQPIIVRQDGIGQFMVIAGERRLRAFQLLKEPKIKAIIRNSYDSDRVGYIQVAENIKRSDLKFYELAEFIVSKLDSGVKQTTLADELGMTKQLLTQYAVWRDAPEFLKIVRDKFNSIRAFYDLVNLAKENEAEVSEFVNSSEGRITSVEVRAFKKRLQDPEAEEAEKDSPEALHESESKTQGDLLDQQTGASEQQVEVDENQDEQHVEDGVETESAQTQENGSDFISSEETGQNNFDEKTENGLEPQESTEIGDDLSESPDLESADDSEFQTDAEEFNSDSVSVGSEVDEGKIKHPLIIGSVEGREGYLQFKRKPTAEGLLWVKWEDGFEEEIIAEKFRINRITEE